MALRETAVGCRRGKKEGNYLSDFGRTEELEGNTEEGEESER